MTSTNPETPAAMYCSSCGKQAPDNAAFCPHCGTALAPNLEPKVEPAPVVVQPAAALAKRYDVSRLPVWCFRAIFLASFLPNKSGHIRGAASSELSSYSCYSALGLTLNPVYIFAYIAILAGALLPLANLKPSSTRTISALLGFGGAIAFYNSASKFNTAAYYYFDEVYIGLGTYVICALLLAAGVTSLMASRKPTLAA